MPSIKLRRLSLQEGEGSKIKRFNVQYPQTIIQQHQLDKQRLKELRKQQRLKQQEIQKNTILSTSNAKCLQSSSTSKCKQNQRRIGQINNIPKLTTPNSKEQQYRVVSRLSSNSHYEGVKQIFLKTNFQRPQYQAQKLLIVDPYIENKENITSIYNLKPTKLLEKLVTQSRMQSYSTSRNYILKSPKSFTTLLSVRSVNFS